MSFHLFGIFCLVYSMTKTGVAFPIFGQSLMTGIDFKCYYLQDMTWQCQCPDANTVYILHNWPQFAMICNNLNQVEFLKRAGIEAISSPSERKHYPVQEERDSMKKLAQNFILKRFLQPKPKHPIVVDSSTSSKNIDSDTKVSTLTSTMSRNFAGRRTTDQSPSGIKQDFIHDTTEEPTTTTSSTSTTHYTSSSSSPTFFDIWSTSPVTSTTSTTPTTSTDEGSKGATTTINSSNTTVTKELPIPEPEQSPELLPKPESGSPPKAVVPPESLTKPAQDVNPKQTGKQNVGCHFLGKKLRVGESIPYMRCRLICNGYNSLYRKC